MMKRQYFVIIGLGLMIALLLAACGAQATPGDQEQPAPSEGAQVSQPTEEPAADQPTEEPPADQPTEEPAGAVTNAVEVVDQEPGAGNTVVVPSVTADVAGWMVIHAAGDGGPGPVIGYTAVPAGTSTDVIVGINPAGMTGTLYAMLHIDAGVEGTYEFPGEDVPAKDAEDKVAMKPFVLTGNAVGVADQPLVDDHTVTVQAVLSAQAGWIVIHADNAGAPGPILGYAPVAAGFNSNVAVEIDGEAATETLYAMLHVDAGTAGEFEFPGGDDVPAKDMADNVVTPPFKLLDASVEVIDQELGEGNTVVVPLVVAKSAGWIVIHADNDGAPGPILGFAPVHAGVNLNVMVEIDADAATPTIYAMLHIDAGTAGEFEFPGGDDVPSRNDAGDVVVKPFALS